MAQIEELAVKSKQTTQDLNKSIKANAKAMLELEKNLLTEIDDLAQASKRRDETLDKKTDELVEGLNKADTEIQASQARLIKMQAIDQALEKRSEALEATTGELTKKSRELSRSTTTLNQRTQQLAQAVNELQETTQLHTGMIAGLQERAEKTANALFAAIMLEKRHFRLLSASLILLLIGFLGFMLYDQANWQEESSTNAALQSGITIVSDDLAATANRLAEIDDSLGELQQKSQLADAAVQEEISTINHKLTTIGDQVDSLDGRLTNLRPHQAFGNGNVIHGPEWLSQQAAGQYVIHLATLDDKQSLYQLAERYSHYLNADLAYLPVEMNGAQQYALVYGKFESQAKAASAMSRMPRYIERQRPSVHQMETVQRYIAEGS